MSEDHDGRTEPFLPHPIAGDVMAALVRPPQTMAEADARLERLSTLRAQISAATDTVELAIGQNHADYLGGRSCWTYETLTAIKYRLRTLKRQRQDLQDALGLCKSWMKRHQHELTRQARAEQAQSGQHGRALRFVQAAELLLDPQTLTMLWELVDRAEGRDGARLEEHDGTR